MRLHGIRHVGARVAGCALLLLVSGSMRAAVAQRDTSAKAFSADSAAVNDSAMTVAQVETAGIKLLGVFDAASGEWIHGAVVRDTLGNQAVTTDIGVAALTALSPVLHMYMLEIRKEGYAPAHFKLRADTASEFLVSLEPNPLGHARTLPTVVTTALQTLERDPGLREGFFTRCQMASTACVGRKDLDLRPTEPLEDLVANTHGITIKCPTTRRPTDDATCLIKMVTFPPEPGPKEAVVEGLYCTPTFFLNGTEWSPLSGGSQQQLNQFLVPANIDGIEIYLSGEARPVRWSIPSSHCGAIVIWTH